MRSVARVRSLLFRGESLLQALTQRVGLFRETGMRCLVGQS